MKLRRAAFWGFEIVGVMLVVAALVVFLVAQYSSATLGVPLLVSGLLLAWLGSDLA
jgi:hypothetical protein